MGGFVRHEESQEFLEGLKHQCKVFMLNATRLAQGSVTAQRPPPLSPAPFMLRCQECRRRMQPHGPQMRFPSCRWPCRRFSSLRYQHTEIYNHHRLDRPGHHNLRERGRPRWQPDCAGYGENRQGGCHHCQGRPDHGGRDRNHRRDAV